MPPESIEKAVKLWGSDYIESADFVLLIPQSDENPNDRKLYERIRTAFISKLGIRPGVVLQGEDAQCLLDLYSLYAFTGKLIVGSFDLPHGRKLRNLIECGMATEDELIDDVILGVMDE